MGAGMRPELRGYVLQASFCYTSDWTAYLHMYLIIDKQSRSLGYRSRKKCSGLIIVANNQILYINTSIDSD